jgi:protein involved in sex pheromone biosynthesis
MNVKYLYLALVAGAMMPLACEKHARYVDASSAYYSRTDYTYEQRDEFRVEMQAASEKLEKRLTELKDEISRGTRTAKADTQKAIATIESGLTSLRKELSGTGSTVRAGWDDFKRGITNTIDDLGRRLDSEFTS